MYNPLNIAPLETLFLFSNLKSLEDLLLFFPFRGTKYIYYFFTSQLLRQSIAFCICIYICFCNLFPDIEAKWVHYSLMCGRSGNCRPVSTLSTFLQRSGCIKQFVFLFLHFLHFYSGCRSLCLYTLYLFQCCLA